jgi:hypothetical protein
MAKNPAEFFVNMKLQAIAVPDSSRAVNTPTSVPAGALFCKVKLLILMVISSPGGNDEGEQRGGPSKTGGGAMRDSENHDIAYTAFCQYVNDGARFYEISGRDADLSVMVC